MRFSEQDCESCSENVNPNMCRPLLPATNNGKENSRSDSQSKAAYIQLIEFSNSDKQV